MVNRLRALKFHAVVAFIVGSVWLAAWELSATTRADVGYLPPPSPDAVKAYSAAGRSPVSSSRNQPAR